MIQNKNEISQKSELIKNLLIKKQMMDRGQNSLNMSKIDKLMFE